MSRGQDLQIVTVALAMIMIAAFSAAVLDWLLSRRVPRLRVGRIAGTTAGTAESAALGPSGGWRWVMPSHRQPVNDPPGGRRARSATVRALGWAAAGVGVLATGSVLGSAAQTLGIPVPPGPVLFPLTCSVAAVASTTGWLAAQTGRRRRAAQMRGQVVEACEALASGLRAGLPPDRLLQRTAEDVPLLLPAASAARLGADVAPALRAVTGTPGAERLAMLAAAWDVARSSGAGLADVVSRIATMVRADAGRQRQVDAALGGARSTARLFAVLPLLGIALGAGMDADPVGVLTRSALGAWALCLGATLACVGLVWVERLSVSGQQ